MENNVKPYIHKTIMYENNTRITFEKLTILRFQTSQCPQFCQSPIFNNFFVFDNQYKKKCIGSYANSRQSSALSCHKSNKKTKILYLIIFLFSIINIRKWNGSYTG